MNKEQIEQSLLGHSDGAIKDMYNQLCKNNTMRNNNQEYFELLEREIDRRKAQVNNILD